MVRHDVVVASVCAEVFGQARAAVQEFKSSRVQDSRPLESIVTLALQNIKEKKLSCNDAKRKRIRLRDAYGFAGSCPMTCMSMF